MIERTAAGAAFAVLIAGAGRLAGALTTSGFGVAVAMGTLAVAAGWRWGFLLILFFVTSSALSRAGAARKAERVRGIVEKGGARDAVQVAANGGVFAAACIGFLLWPDPMWSAAGAGALAAAAADTWGTEIGTLARGTPRMVTTLRPVPPGTSGAVTIAGLGATGAGALVVAAGAAALGWTLDVVAAAFVGGVAGAMADSLIGATVQARRRCATCGAQTERRVHLCGTPTRLAGGLAWLDNDAVNLLSTIVGAVVAATLTF